MPLPLPLRSPMPGGGGSTPGPPPAPVTEVWYGTASRNPVAFATEPPALVTLATPTPPFFAPTLGNTAGQWLFAVVSWRQDAGQPGVLLYPSTVNVSDDAANFWIPLAVTPPEAGIIRTAVWMAPAARAAELMFASPTAWQAAMLVTLFQAQAECPWYQVAANVTTFTNQGSSVSLTQAVSDPGALTIGAIAWDNLGAAVTTSALTWSAVQVLGVNNTTSNFVNNTGDLAQEVWISTSPGVLSASSSTVMDWSGITVTVHGVTDVLPFPYASPIQDWPAVVTEIAADPALNSNPLILNGATDWTAQSGTIAAVNWPAWNPNPYYQTLITQSLQLTPSGAAQTSDVVSGQQPVSAVLQYSAFAVAYSVAGLPSGVTAAVFINWYAAGPSFLSTSSGTPVTLSAGAWTPLTFAAPVYPPGTAVTGQVGVYLTSAGLVPSTAVVYVGYCAFGGSDGYENLQPDQITWNDVSSYNWAKDSMKVERGIQFEQQSLEAGTASFTLDNTAYPFMFGNTEAARWPNIGDTDVPARIRLVNPASITPYTVLFSGYTDDVDFGTDPDSYQAWAQFTCSDAWSRLTQQMVNASLEEILEDNPVGLWSCADSGANQAPGAVTPVQSIASQYGTVSLSGGGSISTGYGATFGGSAIQLPGSQGATSWQSAVNGTVPASNFGVALGYFPALTSGDALPPVSGGVTLEFWVNTVAGALSQPATLLTLVACWSGTGIMWEITLDNTGSNLGVASVSVYDAQTGARTTTSLGVVQYINAFTQAGSTFFFAVTFSQSSLTVTADPTQAFFSTTTVNCNLSAVMTGFTFGGNAGPVYAANSDGHLGFFASLAISNVALFGYIVPASRITQHYLTASSAWPSEIDTWRLARVAGYSGFVPVLGMRGADILYSGVQLYNEQQGNIPDVDPVTAITDTSGQVVSSYFTNIASSTLAAMFVSGPGALIYRRRLEWYDRPVAQYVIGEAESLPLNADPAFRNGVSLWFAENNAALTAANLPAGRPSPVFSTAALFAGDGVTANPQIAYGALGHNNGVPVTPGLRYQLTAWAYSPQGWATGLSVQVNWKTSSFSSITSVNGPVVGLSPGSLAYLEVPATQAPATAAWAFLNIIAAGTPPGTTGFYAGYVAFTQVPPVTAGGATAAALEAPALTDAKLSSDRAQLFNQAILNQSGTNTLTTFSGASLNFSPSSGVVVIIQNNPSVTTRGSIPYTATIYLDNTQQALPYQLDEGSIEDVGNWIVQTLGQPLFRPLSVTLTPVATPSALNTGLMVEVGDTVTFRRRFPGAPEMQIVTYCSKLSHEIDQSKGTWNVQLELSPLPQAFALACDDVVHGVLTSGNLFGW